MAARPELKPHPCSVLYRAVKLPLVAGILSLIHKAKAAWYTEVEGARVQRLWLARPEPVLQAHGDTGWRVAVSLDRE